MKKKFQVFVALVVILVGISQVSAQSNSQFTVGQVPDIRPIGWLHTLMMRQHDGLTGHPEALSYPYNSCLWAGEISRPDESYGNNWWRYEQTAYYTDGLLRLGYELGDSAMIDKACEGIEYTFEHVSETGELGNQTLKGITWPMSVFFRVLQAKYEHDGDERIPKALERHCLNFSKDDLAGGIVGGRNIMSLEGMLWTYGKTGNPKLLQLAEEAWAIQNRFALDETAITSSEPFYMHGVTFCEMLKLPMLLYAYTGKQHYLDLAMQAIRKLEQESMLPDGVPSSAEFLLGNDIHISHETCDVVDFSWTLCHYLSVTGAAEWADKIENAIYNAGMGAITKDFRSLQYFSSLNQFIATGTSNHNIYKHGSTWMAYRPTHETECCSGNVNRMLPNFVSRMWMTDSDGGAVAAIYGPCEATFKTAGGNLSITDNTRYPFDETLCFTVEGDPGASIPLTLRIPAWCENASLKINDIDANLALVAGTFVKLPEAVKNGDRVLLMLPMPVEKEVIEGQGVCFRRGPLLLSYAIPHKMEEDLTEYANMHGKKPDNPDFKCWNITPTGDFNYASTADGSPVEVGWPDQIEPEGSIPFDAEYAPFDVVVPVKQIKWELEDGRYTPHLPEQGHLELLSPETKYIRLIPYGCTELRLTVFPDAEATPLPNPAERDYTRPADAPSAVVPVEGHWYTYFEMPRFCWDEPVYCKVRTAGDNSTDLRNTQGGDRCAKVGTTANGRIIWQWTGSAVTEETPEELVFTNQDVITDIMPFVQGGYYNYRELVYKTEQTSNISLQSDDKEQAPESYDLSGCRMPSTRDHRTIYIQNGKKALR